MNEKIKVWNYACGGYRNVSGRTFPTYEMAYEKMKEDYRDVRSAWEGCDPDELDEGSYIGEMSAEVYCDSMDADEAWIAVIEEEEIEVKIPLGMPAPKVTWLFKFRGPWRSEDVSLTFDSEDEALAAMHESVLDRVKDDFYKCREIDDMDYDQFVKAINEALSAAADDFSPLGELASILAEKYDIHDGAEFTKNIYADTHAVVLPDLKNMDVLEWDVSEV